MFGYLYSYLSQETEGRAFAQVKTTYVKKLPIPLNASSDGIDSLVKQIASIKTQDANADVSRLERQIDELVYSVYGLTKDEIKTIESGVS